MHFRRAERTRPQIHTNNRTDLMKREDRAAGKLPAETTNTTATTKHESIKTGVADNQQDKGAAVAPPSPRRPRSGTTTPHNLTRSKNTPSHITQLGWRTATWQAIGRHGAQVYHRRRRHLVRSRPRPTGPLQWRWLWLARSRPFQPWRLGRRGRRRATTATGGVCRPAAAARPRGQSPGALRRYPRRRI